MPITPINFTDAPEGWEPGDSIPDGSTPINAAALEGIQTHVGDYADTLVAADRARLTDLEDNAGGGGTGNVSSNTITDIVTLTQGQYDALEPPDATTLYIIT